MLPNMARTVKRFSVDATHHVVTNSIVNFRKEQTEVDNPIRIMIQPQNTDKLNKDKVDYSLKYILVHSLIEIKIDDFITHNNIKYRCFDKGDWSLYGFFVVIMEEVK